MEPTDFEKRTREVLEESTSRLDARTLSRLTQARHAALEQGRRPVRPRWWALVPAGAAAAVAVLAVVMWTGQPGNPQDPPTTAQNPPPIATPFEDLEMLTDADAAEFVADGEDLEFYEWAAGEVES
jgi:negative regulator of sigma E activity